MPTLRDKIASSLSQAAEQVKPRASRHELAQANIYLQEVQKFLGRSFPDDFPKRVWRVVVPTDDPGGPQPAVDKARAGLLAITDHDLIISRATNSLGRILTQTFPNRAFRADPIGLKVKKETLPGVRLTATDPKFHGIVIVAGLVSVIGGNANKVTSIRDAMAALINSESSDVAGAAVDPVGTAETDSQV